MLLSMLEIELYQIFLSLGRGRSGYEIKLKCDVTFILISRAAILLASSTGERDRGSVDEKCILLENTYSCILHIFCHTDLHRPPYRPMPWRKCETLLDSGFHAVDSGFLASGILACSAQAFSLPRPTIWTPRTGLYNFGFRNLKVCGISDSLSRVPDSKAQISNSRICITLNEATHNSLSLYLPVPFFVSVFLPHRQNKTRAPESILFQLTASAPSLDRKSCWLSAWSRRSRYFVI